MTAPRDLAAEARAKADTLRIHLRPATALLLTELADRIDELEAVNGYAIGRVEKGTIVEVAWDAQDTPSEAVNRRDYLRFTGGDWRAYALREVSDRA